MVNVTKTQNAVLDVQAAPKQVRQNDSAKFSDSLSKAVDNQEKPPVQSASDAKPPSKQQEADDGQKVDNSQTGQDVESPDIQEELEQGVSIIDTIASAMNANADQMQIFPQQPSDNKQTVTIPVQNTLGAQAVVQEDQSLEQIPKLVDLFKAIDAATDVQSQNAFVQQAVSEIDKLLGVSRPNPEAAAALNLEQGAQKQQVVQPAPSGEVMATAQVISTVTFDGNAGSSSFGQAMEQGDTGSSDVKNAFIPDAKKTNEVMPHFMGQVTRPADNAQPAQNALPDVVEVDIRQGRDVMITKLVESIKSAVTQEKNELQIQFKPSVMGGLAVKLSMAADGLTAQIVTQNKVASAMMAGEIAVLVESLKEKGITVQRMEVMDQSANGATYGNGNNNEGNNGFSQSSYFSQGNNQPTRQYVNVTEERRSVEAAYDNMIVALPMAQEDGVGTVYSA